MNSEQRQPPPSVFRPDQLGPILFITMIFFLTFVSRVLISPLMPKIEESLGLTHTESGALFLFMAVGYVISLIGSGFVSARICHKKTIVLAACGVGLGLCMVSLSGSIWSLRGAVFAVGLAAGLYLPSGITTLTDMIDARQWGRMISLHELAPNLGFITAPLIAEMLLIFMPWRGVPLVLGIVAIGLGLLFAAFGKGGDFPGKIPDINASRALFAIRDFWIMVVLFGLAISGTMGIYMMLPLYLVNEVGLSSEFANTLISMSRLLGMGASLLSGWATDRFGPRRTLMVILGMIGTSTILLGAAQGKVFVLTMLFIQASFATTFFPAGYAVLSAVGPPEYRNVAVSFTVPFAFIFGGGIAPTLIGLTGDAGSFGAGIALIGILIAASAILPRFLACRVR